MIVHVEDHGGGRVTIYGSGPVPRKRAHRHGRHGTYSVNPEQDDFAAHLGWKYRWHPLDGPVRVDLLLEVPARARDKADSWCETKPDHDNVWKGVCDALERGGVLANDSRLVDTRFRKVRRLELRGGEARWCIRLTPPDDVPPSLEDWRGLPLG